MAAPPVIIPLAALKRDLLTVLLLSTLVPPLFVPRSLPVRRVAKGGTGLVRPRGVERSSTNLVGNADFKSSR